MPKIVIQEYNLTRATGSGVGTDIVYIPGFMGKAFNGIANTPILCTNMDEFEMYFGSDPFEYEDENKNTHLDSGFIYAKECLNVNLPVIYEAIKAEEVNIQVSGDGVTNNVATISLSDESATDYSTTLTLTTPTLTTGSHIFSYEVFDEDGKDVAVVAAATSLPSSSNTS